MRTLLLSLLACTFCAVGAFAQTVYYSSGFERNQAVVPSGTNEWRDIKTDSQGNSYVLAHIVADQVFNGQTYSAPTNLSARLLIKYNSSGQVQWVVTTGNPQGDIGSVLLLDASENPVVIGNIGQLDQASAVRNRLAVTKYDASNGSVVFQNVATEGTGIVRSADFDSDGNILIALEYSSIDDPIEWGQISNFFILTGDRQLIIKTDPSGNALWVEVVNSSPTTVLDGEVLSMSIGENNAIYLTGFSDSVTAEGVIIMKLDSAANLEWYKRTGNNSNGDWGVCVLYHNEAVYLAGKVGDLPLDFGNGVSSSENIPQGFVAKFSTSGQAQWMVRNSGTTWTDVFKIYKVFPMSNGNIATYGDFSSSNAVIGGVAMTSSLGPWSLPTKDAIVLEIDTAGNLLNKFNTVGNIASGQVACGAPDNSVWIGGVYAGGALQIGSNTLPAIGGTNDKSFFIARVGLGPLSTGLDESKLDQMVTVYPNPFSESTTISSSFGEFENATISIYNSMGQLARLMSNATGKEVKIDRGGLPAGNYFFRIVGDSEGVQTGRLVIE